MTTTEDINHILVKLDIQHKESSEHLSKIDLTLAVQAEQLTYHIKRTDLLEELVQSMRDSQKTLERHVDRVELIWKILCRTTTGAVILFGLVMTAYKVFV